MESLIGGAFISRGFSWNTRDKKMIFLGSKNPPEKQKFERQPGSEQKWV